MLGRWAFVTLLLVGVVGAAWFGLPEAQKKITEGDVVENFKLPDLKGDLHSIPKGEVVLLNFWATWCPPCRQEMPSMIALSKKYESQGLKVIAVSVDRDATALKNFVDEYKIPFLVLNDADSVISSGYGVFRYPETFLIDREGRVQAHMLGAVDWMLPQIQGGIENLLKGKGLAQAK